MAAQYGFDTSDGDIQRRCLEWLDEAVNDLNYMTWESSKTVETGIPLTSGDTFASLSSQFYKESQAYLVSNDGGDMPPMRYLPWVAFKRLYPDMNTPGMPCIYTAFNDSSEGKVYFDVVVDDNTASNYTLAVEYYRRIPKISSLGVGDSLEVPTEFENVLLYGAKKRAAQWVGAAQDVPQFQALEHEAYERMKRADRMHPDSDNRFRLIDDQPFVRYPTGQVYPY